MRLDGHPSRRSPRWDPMPKKLRWPRRVKPASGSLVETPLGGDIEGPRLPNHSAMRVGVSGSAQRRREQRLPRGAGPKTLAGGPRSR
jgi:hypothetical protein